MQPCHKRAKGKLLALVLGSLTIRDATSLHHHDVEWLVTNFLMIKGFCSTIWTGGRSFENIDHAGCSSSGKVLLAQTTVSSGMVGKKAARLRELAAPDRELFMFGPESAREQCPPEIHFFAIEDVFAALDSVQHGQWLIDAMLGSTADRTSVLRAVE